MLAIPFGSKGKRVRSKFRAVVAIIIIIFLRIYAAFSYKGPFHKEEVKQILVYGYTGLGNFIQFTPALKKLREAFPQAHITLQAGLDWGAEEAWTIKGKGGTLSL